MKFTSDLHWFHNNICKLANRPWTQEENTESLIKTWNRNVAPGDTCWHLGDFMFVRKNQFDKAQEVLDQLNGNIRLILGNHDSSRFWAVMQERNPKKIISVDKFKEIHVSIGDKKYSFTLCHFPLMVWNRSQYGTIHLHGHQHGSTHHPGRAIDVGLDGAEERLGDWRFWTETDIVDYLKDQPVWKPSGDHHRIIQEEIRKDET